ncbi:MAG: dipeptide ABC transporter ATP-binding protein [Hyphomicrobiales bacterium]
MTDAPVLELEGVSVAYRTHSGEVPAVVGVSLELREGESLGLVGESGCGKSTIAFAVLRHLAGRGRVTGGAIRFRGRDMTNLSDEALRRMRGGGIAMVYQEPMAALNPSMRIGEQLAEVPVAHDGASWGEARRRAEALLADVKLADPGRIMASYPHQLSGGQQQRVVIAMALLARPAVLLLDEPTTGLDVTVEAGVVDLIAGLRAKFGTSLLYISHNLGLLLRVCDRIAVMYSGEIVEEGRAASIYAERRHPYTRGLFACLPNAGTEKEARPLRAIRGTVGSPLDRPRGCYFGPRCDAFTPGLCDIAPVPLERAGDGAVRCLRWRALPAEVPAPALAAALPASARDIALEALELTKDYAAQGNSPLAWLGLGSRRHVRANDRVSLRAPARRTLAIVGESGCGKSTFARVLMGLERATSGALIMDDADLAALPVRRRSQAQLRAVQMVFQNPDETLNPSYPVGWQISRVVRRFGLGNAPERLAAILEAVRLPAGIARSRPGRLSGGQKQRVAIARAFIGEPRLVVADEPVSALDVSVRAAVVELLMDLQRRRGTTLILISHDLDLVRYAADQVVVMYLGRVMEAGTTRQVFAPPFHPYTAALLSAIPAADPSIEYRRTLLSGELPSPLDPPRGCPFHTRCPRKLGTICETERPAEQVADGHRIACHIPRPELMELRP